MITTMLILEKLNDKQLFSHAEINVANYIKKAGLEIENKTVRMIANDSFVAPSAVIRFCQKLGYEGYNDFKKDYLEELHYISSHFQKIDPNYPFSPDDKNVVIAGKIGSLYEETIKDCLSLIEHDSLQQAMNMIIKAKVVYICASSTQSGIAMAFKEKMYKIGKQVIILGSEDESYYTALYASTNDSCFILISYSGETEKCTRVSKKLQERSVPSLTITSFGTNTLSQLSDICLYVSTREKLISNLGGFSFNVCVMLLLDILYAGYFNSHYKQHLKDKIKHATDYEKTEKRTGRSSQNPILKEE